MENHNIGIGELTLEVIDKSIKKRHLTNCSIEGFRFKTKDGKDLYFDWNKCRSNIFMTNKESIRIGCILEDFKNLSENMYLSLDMLNDSTIIEVYYDAYHYDKQNVPIYKPVYMNLVNLRIWNKHKKNCIQIPKDKVKLSYSLF